MPFKRKFLLPAAAALIAAAPACFAQPSVDPASRTVTPDSAGALGAGAITSPGVPSGPPAPPAGPAPCATDAASAGAGALPCPPPPPSASAGSGAASDGGAPIWVRPVPPPPSESANDAVGAAAGVTGMPGQCTPGSVSKPC